MAIAELGDCPEQDANNPGTHKMNRFDDLIADLQQKRDELRVQIHLASKDIQDDWEELEDKMEDIAEKAGLEETSEGIGDAIELLGDELKNGYQRIRDAIKEA